MSGQVAMGENYFPRPEEEAKVWRYLNRGSHLILLAPRRFGKTSLLRAIEKNPRKGYVFLYCMVQSCKTEHDIYKRILEALHETDFVSNLQKAARKGKNYIVKAINTIKCISIGETGIKLNKNHDRVTHQDIINAIDHLSLDQKLIIILDEYPDVVEEISSQQGHQAARQLLSHTRELCQHEVFNQRAQLIFTGSIGLDTLTTKLQLSSLINDKEKLLLSPLTQKQALEFIRFITNRNNSNITLNESVSRYLLKKVEWLVPYYIEILWERLEDHCDSQDIIDPGTSDIDTAYEALFTPGYAHFNHWVDRLRRFNTDERKLAKEILGYTATHGQITRNQYNNIYEKHTSINTHYIIDCLVHDGYLFESQERIYQFTSPILKDWWNRYANRTL